MKAQLTRCFFALALLLVTALASASSHREWTRAAAGTLPVYFEDKAPELAAAKADQISNISQLVADASQNKAPRPPREWAALLLTIGYHESTFSLRIHRGDCRPKECDAGRARSSWQMHRNDFTAPVWDKLFGLENTAAQVAAADAMLRRAYWQCSRSGVPWLQATLNAYAGLRCSASWPGLDQRMATWSRLVRVGVSAKGAS